MRTISGEQYVLRFGTTEAWVASVGATLRSLTHDGVDVVMPFAAEEERPAMGGALLAPWPNRTANARYRFGGEWHSLHMNEPERGNASHGLVAGLDFALAASTSGGLTLTAAITPCPGYPWQVRLDVSFSVGEGELRQSVKATNESPVPAPFGLGGHPYFLAGPAQAGAIEAWSLELPAEEVLLVDPVRYLPTERVTVGDHDQGRFDFRTARTIGDTVLNHAFTGLRRQPSGVAIVRLLGAGGRGVELEVDGQCTWVQLYTADAPGTPQHRHALAVEPMTCPPDALNSGIDLRILEPGESTTVSWTVRSIGG